MNIISEEEIDFNQITDSKKFEELCFDLILKCGFNNIRWRQGGPDSGRDIEAYMQYNSQLVENYNEKWFFECKHYTNGVPVQEISSKIDWAVAERAKHLVIMTSSYLSQSALDFVNKRSNIIECTIHVLDGKHLKRLIILYEDIVFRYFSSEKLKLIYSNKKNWLFFGVFPQATIFYNIVTTLDWKTLKKSDRAFLLISAFNLEGFLDPFDSSLKIIDISKSVTSDLDFDLNNKSVLDGIENLIVLRAKIGSSQWLEDLQEVLLYEIKFGDTEAIYFQFNRSLNEVCEILIEKNSNFTTLTSIISKDVDQFINKIHDMISS